MREAAVAGKRQGKSLAVIYSVVMKLGFQGNIPIIHSQEIPSYQNTTVTIVKVKQRAFCVQCLLTTLRNSCQCQCCSLVLCFVL